MDSAISCVLIDVGGTLWPSGWAATEAIEQARCERLADVLPALAPPRNVEFSRQLNACRAEYARLVERDNPLSQDIDAVIHSAARRLGLRLDAAGLGAIRDAVCVSPVGRLELFPGARELLARVKSRGWHCVAVSNAGWRNASAYRRDFDDLGIGRYVDAVISSVDVGFRKPHPAPFEAALAAAGCRAAQAVMIGNSAHNDVQPAVALGLRAILVAIEKPRPAVRTAHGVVDSLYDAAAILERWARDASLH